MPAEAPAPPSPEMIDIPMPDSSNSMELPSSAQQAADFARWEEQVSEKSEFNILDTSINIAGTDFLELLFNQPQIEHEGVMMFKMPEQAMTLVDKELPVGARQNMAIISVVYEIADLAPELMGYIMGSGRTWWFAPSGEAMERDPDYVAGFFRGFVEEKLAWA